MELPSFLTDPDPTIYETGVPLFLDFETTTEGNGLAIYKSNRIVLACWQLGWDGPMMEKWGSEFEMDELLEAVSKADFLVAFNAKFELQWLARCGLELENILVYDVQIAEYVIGGNRWQTSMLSLESTAVRHSLPGKVSIVSKMIKAGVPTEDVPREWMKSYCRRDVALLPVLMKRQLTSIAGSRLLPVIYSRCLLTPVLSEMEFQGLQLDADLVRTMCEEKEQEFRDLTEQLNKMTGGINLSPSLALDAYLYDKSKLNFEEHKVRKQGKWVPQRTATNRRMMGAEAIATLKATTKEQRTFQELYKRHRSVSTELTKYLRKFKACCDEAGGVLYAKFNQTQTQTHRLSSSGLAYSTQFQNLPRAYKKLFIAKRSGWLVGEADGAQLEFRIAVHLGRDEQGLADIRNKVDVHAFTSKTLTDAGQETDRQGAKEHTFKPLYGGSSGTDAEQVYYKAFKAKYPGITATQGRWINTVLMEKKLETEWGLTYYWPDTRLDRSGYVTNSTAICNYPVQALATAEVIPLALVFMWHRLKRMEKPVGIVLVNTIHDSVAAEVDPSWTDIFHALAKQCLIDDASYAMRALYGIHLFCPLGCGVKVGVRWGAGEEVKYEQEETNG